MNKYKTFILFTIYLLVLDIVFSLLLFKYISLSNIFFYLLESITTSSIICLISDFFKGRLRKIVPCVIISFISIIYIAQFVHYNFYDCFFSIYSLVNGGQVFGFISSIVKEITDNIIGFLILFIFFIGINILIIKSNFFVNSNKLVWSLILIVNIFVTLFFIYIVPSNSFYSRKNLVSVTNTETNNVESLGLITSMSIDLKRFIGSTDYKLDIDKNNENYDSSKYNILNISFDNIRFSDKNKNRLNEYFKNEVPTNKNKYTGVFKDKNLIFITAESFSFSVIDKDRTPTLYKLYSEGFNFSNFYTPIYYASTSDGEYSNITGLLPKEGTWSFIESKKNYFPFSYANLFKDKNYKTNAYHNNTYTFYNRNEVMPGFGYDFKACGNGIEKIINCNIWPQSDDDMINRTLNEYINSDKFHTYYMSVSMHLPHNFKDNDIAKKYEDKVNNLEYSDHTKAYLSSSLELDRALGNLLNNLEKNDKLDDTVIVLVPDHYPYGLSDKEYSEIKNLDTPYAKHKSGLIIYNSKVKGENIEKYASNIDILPTLLNMFGIDFDSRLIIGKDIMSDSEGIVMFNDRSFLTKEGYYSEKTNKFTSFDKNVDPNYIRKKQKEVRNKNNVSSMILENDYYKYLKTVID